MSEAQREHVKYFMQMLSRFKEMNLGASSCRTLALENARREHPLNTEEQTAVDVWLAEKCPPPKLEPPREEYPSVFAEVSRMVKAKDKLASRPWLRL